MANERRGNGGKQKSGISVGAAILLVILSVGITYGVMKLTQSNDLRQALEGIIPIPANTQTEAPSATQRPSDSELYAYAFLDTVFAPEQLPVVRCLKENEELISFGEGVYGTLWYSRQELERALGDDASVLRLKQLLGYAPEADISSVRVIKAENGVYRAASFADTGLSVAPASPPALTAEQEQTYCALCAAHSRRQLVFTGLGCTYDWSNNGGTQGIAVYALANDAKTVPVAEYQLNGYLASLNK